MQIFGPSMLTPHPWDPKTPMVVVCAREQRRTAGRDGRVLRADETRARVSVETAWPFLRLRPVSAVP